MASAGSGVDWGLIVAVLVFLFTAGSFWWLYARRGSLEVGRPGAYAFANKVRLRLPLAFYNTGAKSLIVTDLQAVLVDERTRPPCAGSRPSRSYGPAAATNATSLRPLP